MSENKIVNLHGDGFVGRKCVMCKHISVERFKPFCSKRCADLDLGKWLNGSYVVSDDGQDDENDYSSTSIAEFDPSKP
ncbi:MAG: DNA gyrase inhibitor YacG [Rhizobiales bacterium]|nr:DNA gyrase inhibitor YacG [Hyphomicrobiales bacterium]NRB15408.1 DNA gyrase inhibitor YacG [Hyphomicrobiales bacterium]